MSHRACILGCQGQALTADEQAFFREVRPWGFILFARNIQGADQVRALTDGLRRAVDDADTLVFVDQEGGRVQRLRPPLAVLREPAGRFGELYQHNPESAVEAVFLNHRLMAEELSALGIDADCAPSLDLRHPGASGVIGDRAFADRASAVAALGRAAVDGLMAGGVAPVVKHMPGHGRAMADSHLETPVVDAPLDVLEATDFEPFRTLADTPMGMTAHVTFSEVDADTCVTVSRHAIETLIRGLIGFDGLLMSDDLSMKALGGDLHDRARRAVAAGCDLALHGNGALVGEPVRDLFAELGAVASACPELGGRSAERAEAARQSARRRQPFDRDGAVARLSALGLGGRIAA